jgi:aminopeptidase N
MADANNFDLSQFERWYTQSGTPTVKCSKSFDAAAKTLSITLEQTCGAAPNGAPALPFLIPVRVGFLARNSEDKAYEVHKEEVLQLTEARQQFVITGVGAEPVLSLFRNFSAPVKVEYPRDDNELAFLMGNDLDAFNRWEAAQQLFSRAILANAKLLQAKGEAGMTVSPALVAAFKSTLTDTTLDKSLCAYALSTPSLATMAEDMDVVDPDALVAARKFTRRHIATVLRAELLTVYKANTLPAQPLRNDAEAIGMRRLKNVCLGYLAELRTSEEIALIEAQALGATCMTDLASAAACLSAIQCEQRDKVMAHFYDKHAKGNDLIVCKWLTINASACTDDALERANKLLAHPDFSLKNPNKCRSVVLSFASNMKPFHAPDGSGYAWLTSRILEVDAINPQVAAKLTSKLSSWRRFDAKRQALMRQQLQRIQSAPGVSKDTYEIAMRSLA